MQDFSIISYDIKGKQVAYDYASATEQAYHIASLMFVQDNVSLVKIFLQGVDNAIAKMEKH